MVTTPVNGWGDPHDLQDNKHEIFSANKQIKKDGLKKRKKALFIEEPISDSRSNKSFSSSLSSKFVSVNNIMKEDTLEYH